MLGHIGWKVNKLENVILSPHVASYTKETRDKMEKIHSLTALKILTLKIG